MGNRKLLAAICVVPLCYIPTAAVAADVQFNASVNSTCTINVTQNGTLRATANLRTLTSGGTGGQHARAQVITNTTGFRLYVDQPTDLVTRPAGDTAPDQDYRARIRSTGATTFAWTRNDQALNTGNNNVRVQFRVRKAVGAAFAAGNYTGVVVIRCE